MNPDRKQALLNAIEDVIDNQAKETESQHLLQQLLKKSDEQTSVISKLAENVTTLEAKLTTIETTGSKNAEENNNNLQNAEILTDRFQAVVLAEMSKQYLLQNDANRKMFEQMQEIVKLVTLQRQEMAELKITLAKWQNSVIPEENGDKRETKEPVLKPADQAPKANEKCEKVETDFKEKETELITTDVKTKVKLLQTKETNDNINTRNIQVPSQTEPKSEEQVTPAKKSPTATQIENMFKPKPRERSLSRPPNGKTNQTATASNASEVQPSGNLVKTTSQTQLNTPKGKTEAHPVSQKAEATETLTDKPLKNKDTKDTNTLHLIMKGDLSWATSKVTVVGGMVATDDGKSYAQDDFIVQIQTKPWAVFPEEYSVQCRNQKCKAIIPISSGLRRDNVSVLCDGCPFYTLIQSPKTGYQWRRCMDCQSFQELERSVEEKLCDFCNTVTTFEGPYDWHIRDPFHVVDENQ